MDEVRENCGAVCVFSPRDGVGSKIYSQMRNLAHRGEESRGMAVYIDRGPIIFKDTVPVFVNFSRTELGLCNQYTFGIGHNRYSTAGSSTMENAQPIAVDTEFGGFAIGHNGTIRNANYLRPAIEKDGRTFTTTGDTEVLAHLIGYGTDIIDGIKLASKTVSGSWSIVIVAKDGVYAARDPHGFKPLCIGKNEEGDVVVASESCGFGSNGLEHVRDIKPGEIYHVGPDGEESVYLPRKPFALDVFELVYFARTDSIIDGMHVDEFRFQLGRLLGERDVGRFTSDNILLSGVPRSGDTYVEGHHDASGLPLRSVIHRVKVRRSFTQPDHIRRQEIAKTKFAYKRPLIKGRRLVLVDDSIVRGTKMREEIVPRLRNAGAKEIHLRIAYPPVVDTCPFGIDMKTKEEHLANQYPDPDERRRHLGVESLEHGTVADLLTASKRSIVNHTPYGDGTSLKDIGLGECTHCITHKDPESTDPETGGRFRVDLSD